VLRLYYQGHTNAEIAAITGFSDQHVTDIINTDSSKEILGRFQDKTIETILDVQSDAQAIAPAIFEEKIRLALGAKSEQVRNNACSDILAIAGHKPIDRVSLAMDRPDKDPYEGKSEAEIREAIISELQPAIAVRKLDS